MEKFDPKLEKKYFTFWRKFTNNFQIKILSWGKLKCPGETLLKNVKK